MKINFNAPLFGKSKTQIARSNKEKIAKKIDWRPVLAVTIAIITLDLMIILPWLFKEIPLGRMF